MGNRIARTLERLEESQRVAHVQARVSQEEARVAQEQARLDLDLLLAALQNSQAKLLTMPPTFKYEMPLTDWAVCIGYFTFRVQDKRRELGVREC